jgi:hypothetical protein
MNGRAAVCGVSGYMKDLMIEWVVKFTMDKQIRGQWLDSCKKSE